MKKPLFTLLLFLTLLVIASCKDKPTTGETETSQTESVALKEQNLISAFSFKAKNNSVLPMDVIATIDHNTNQITATLPLGTNRRSLVATFTTTGEDVIEGRDLQLSGITVNDYTNPLNFIVRSKNSTPDNSKASPQIYVIIITTPEKIITNFHFKAYLNEALPINIGATIIETNITATLPFGTDVTALVPNITFSGESITPNSGTAQDFSNPLVYRVAAIDGTIKEYLVTLTVQPIDSKEITSLYFKDIHNEALSMDLVGAIDGNNITAWVPFGTDVTALVSEIYFTGASVSPVSGATLNFTNPTIFTVTDYEEGTKEYTVTLTVLPTSAKNILDFSFKDIDNPVLSMDIDATIVGNTITANLPFGTNITALIPDFSTTGASVNPSMGSVQDFTTNVTYSVMAIDGSTQDYTVIVSVLPNSTKDITSFSFKDIDNTALFIDVDATITGTNILVEVPFGTDVTTLTPQINIEGTSLSPTSGIPQNFTNTFNYRVTAIDESTQDYTVTVVILPNTEKDISIFRFKDTDNGDLSTDVTGKINGTNISVIVPFNTNITALKPEITITGTSINPGSGVTKDFSSSLIYTVTAENGSTQDYSILVEVAGLDKDFNSGGSLPGTSFYNALYGSEATDIALDNNGKYVVVGTIDNSSDKDIALWRYNPDGSLDTTFGTGGMVQIADTVGGIYKNDFATALAITGSGKIVIVGKAVHPSDSEKSKAIILRLDNSGNLDTSFDGDGILSESEIVFRAYGNKPPDDGFEDIIIDENGKYIVTGHSINGWWSFMVLLRYNPDGSRDTNFGTSGLVKASSPYYDDFSGKTLQIDNNGYLLVGGEGCEWCIWKYDASGALDTSFGTNGLYSENFGFAEQIFEIVVDSSNDYYATGVNDNNKEMRLVKYKSDGSKDLSFDTDGIVISSDLLGAGKITSGFSLVLDDTENPIIVGRAQRSDNSYDMVLWRYNKDGSINAGLSTNGFLVFDNIAGGNGDDSLSKLILTPDNKVIAVGSSVDGGATTQMAIIKAHIP